MKPAYEKLAASVEDGVNCNLVQGKTFGCVWHFHPEYEITLTRKARGHRMVGDNLTSLKAGDIVLVGSNLPTTGKMMRARRVAPSRWIICASISHRTGWAAVGRNCRRCSMSASCWRGPPWESM